MFACAQAFIDSGYARTVDCLIADVQMPEMSGVELQKYLQIKKVQLPIIFITAYDDEQLRQHLTDQGAICILPKPFDITSLISAVHLALGCQPRKKQTPLGVSP